MLSLETS